MTTNPSEQTPTNEYLTGRQLVLARLAWVLFVLVLTLIRAAGQVAAFREVQQLQLPSETIAGLSRMGLNVLPIALCPAAPPHPGRHRPALLILRSTQDKKYNAQQVGDFNRLAPFARRSQSATARDETDPSLSLRTGMDALLAELERVVQDTLQPEGVKVWLRKG